ncbi:uncharacterized protein [Haliotis asinina]|uniref:uncharacterized protein n=1 Tax=Haliotis asinina TaxID=109174 RepID=UPI00353204DD
MALQRRYSQRNGGLETYHFQPEDTKKCTLRIIFESLGIQFGDETSQLELQVWQWRHIKADTGVLSELDGKLKLNNTERITTINADEIKAVCTGNVYRSPSRRSFGLRTIQKIFQDTASCLCLIQRPVQENRKHNLSKKLCDSSIFVSGKATCFLTRCGIAVVTSKTNEKMVTEATHKLLTGGSYSSSSSASSVDDSSMEDTFTKLQHRRSVQLEGHIVPFFRESIEARNHLILKSKLQGITCTFATEDNKLLLLAGTKGHLDMFNDIYLNCIKQITWDLKDSNIFKVLTKAEVVSECNEYCQLRFPGKAMFVSNDANQCISIAATDDALPQAESHLKEQISKYENGAIKLDDRSFKQVVQHWESIKQIGARLASGKINISQSTAKQAIIVIGTRDAIQDFNTQLDEYLSSPELCFMQLRFQGKKQKLLQSRPKAKEYVEQNVAKSDHVAFELDTQANEFVLVASGEHKAIAREFLSLVKTREVRVRRNSAMGKSLFDLKQELMSRTLPCHEKMLVELDISTGTFTITATNDVFDEAVKQFEDVYKDSTGRVRRESCEGPLSPTSPPVTPVPFQVVTHGNWKNLTVKKYMQNLLQSCPEAKKYISSKMLSDGVQVKITMDGAVQYMDAAGINDQRVESILKNCIEKKDIDFEIYPVGGYLRPSEARTIMKRLLKSLSSKLLIEAEDSQKVLTIISTKDIAAEVIKGVKRFLQDYTYSEETISLTKEETRTFWMQNAELRDVEKSLSEEKVNISLKGSQLMIAGAKVGVEKCKKEITDMRNSQNNSHDTAEKDASHSCSLSNQMTKILQDMPHCRHFVNRVFTHTACSTQVTDDGSRLTRTQRSTKGVSAPSTGQFKKTVKAPLPSRITTMGPTLVKNTMAKKEPVLADRVLIYEDESVLKLLIVGDAADVEKCYRIMLTM